MVFITETDSVYCAVRAECLYAASFNTHKFYVLPTQCICVLYGSQNKQRLFPYTTLTYWLVFITEMEFVYCAVRAGSLNIIYVNVRVSGGYVAGISD